MYYLSCFLLRIAFRILGGHEAAGAANIPKSGGVIIASNHISYVDPPVVGCGTKRQVHFMAKDELFRVPILRNWMRRVGAFPVRRGTADRRALKHAIELLEEGKVVCVFPEGTRSTDGKLRDPELGIGLIALKSRAPVVPTAIIGSDKVLPGGTRRLYRHPVTIIYGEPMTFPDLYDSRDSRHALQEVGRRTMEAIASLMEEHAREPIR